MPAFVYLGTDDPADVSTKAHGHEFVRGEPVEVKDARAVEKLSKHPLFEAAKGKAPAAPTAAETAKPDEVEIPNGWDELHWTQQAAIAQQITGERPENGAAAKEAIEAELVRRAKA